MAYTMTLWARERALWTGILDKPWDLFKKSLLPPPQEGVHPLKFTRETLDIFGFTESQLSAEKIK